VATANAFARAGNRAEALRLLDRISPDASGYTLIWIAMVYGALGDADRAFSVLDRVTNEDPYQIVFLGFDRDFDPIRADPRFEAVRRRARDEVRRRSQVY
jgi:HEAT repeat protein